MANRDDARDRLLLSISEALIALTKLTPMDKVRDQLVHNLTECNKDLLVAASLAHGRPSGWRNQINKINR